MYYVFVFLHTVWTREIPIFRHELWKWLMHLHSNIFHIIRGYLLNFFTRSLICKEKRKKKKRKNKSFAKLCNYYCAIVIFKRWTKSRTKKDTLLHTHKWGKQICFDKLLYYKNIYECKLQQSPSVLENANPVYYVN